MVTFLGMVYTDVILYYIRNIVVHLDFGLFYNRVNHDNYRCHSFKNTLLLMPVYDMDIF